VRLSEVPAGTTIFIDATCFVYHFAGSFPSCALFFERVRRRELIGVTSGAVLGEVHHRLMALELRQRLGRPVRNPATFLKRHPEMIRTLQRCETAFDLLQGFHIRMLPITPRLLRDARRLSHELGLLTNDAQTVAIVHHHHLTLVASSDTDFLRVPGLTLVRP
jgi:predicted nucleic acid-binding protein